MAQKRWILAHKDTFEQVLPPKNAYLASLENEMSRKATREGCIPLRQHDKQPALVTGRKLKSYQVRLLFSFLVLETDDDPVHIRQGSRSWLGV